jgi:hypothetical protein
MNREQRLCTLVVEIQMNEAKEYLQRGRRFERLPPEELSDRWLSGLGYHPDSPSPRAQGERCKAVEARTGEGRSIRRNH